MAIRFTKRRIDTVPFEACSVADVNGDGVPDIVCGEYWYEGPTFEKKHRLAIIELLHEYYDDFANYPLDVDGDGYTDIVCGGWFGKTLQWRRNPGPGTDAEWETIPIDRCGHIETIRAFDIDGCGVPEIFPNTPKEPQAYYKLVRDAEGKGTGVFEKVVIGEGPSGHGLGFADVNGDGRVDIVLQHGWLEQPEAGLGTPGDWKFHEEFALGQASIPVLGYEIAGSGRCDLIVGQAHCYGLDWYEQVQEVDGTRGWRKHEIDATHSQVHDMQLVDLDLDGVPELVTGKRYRAHNDGDPGADDPVGLYYYKLKDGRFEKHVIDYGPAGEHSGCGIYFWVQDLTGNGYPDIVAPGKEGLYLFENRGPEGENIL